MNQNDNNADNFTDPHNAYTFSGTYWDEQTALNYYGARYYDSWNGTWSTQDIYRGMIQDPQSLHRSAFVKNNPVNYVDPEGFSESSLTIQEGKIVFSYSNSGYTPQTGQVGVDFSFTYGKNDGVHIASGALDLVQQNQGHTSTLSALGDAALGFNSKGELSAAAGGAILITKDGKVILRKSGSIGNKPGFNALGVNSSGQYNAEAIKRVEANRQQAIINLKREADQNVREYLANQARLQNLMNRPDLHSGLYGMQGDPWYIFAKDGVAYAFDYSTGLVYSLVDNASMGLVNKGIEWLRGGPIYISEASKNGMKLGDSLSEDVAYFELASGAGMFLNGSKNASGGLLACIPTEGGGCILALVGGGEMLAGTALDAHGGATLNYLSGKESNFYQSQGSGGNGSTWGNSNTLDDHFQRHGADFGYNNVDEYIEGANDFFKSADNPDILKKVDSDGVIRLYDPKTNTFGSYNPDGTTKTFYKPDPDIHGYQTNYDYWLSQPGQ